MQKISSFNTLSLVNFFFLSTFIFHSLALHAQEPPDRRFLFLEDRAEDENERRSKREFKSQERKVREAQQSGSLPFDIDANSISYDSTRENIQAYGNLSLVYSSMRIEADQGLFNVPSNSVELLGDITVSDVLGDLSCDRAKLNLKTGEAKIENADFDFNQGNYKLLASSMERSAGDTVFFNEANLTTCRCPEGSSADGEECVPWQLSARKGEVTKDGYGKLWDTTLDVYGVPVFYLPYFVFPVKRNRQTGLLPARIGVGRDSEFQLELPFFWATSRSSDLTLTPFIQTKTRAGLRSELRKVFSNDHKVQLGALFSDEKARGDDLFGTNIEGLSDPSIDSSRTAAWLNHDASFSIGNQPFRYIARGRFVSDDLTLREIDLPVIGESSDRFVTSTALLRTSVSDSFVLDLSAEYNQAIVTDDDLVFQRLPELSLTGFKSFNTFGINSYGLKSVLNTQLEATNFSRQQDYDGSRVNLFQSIKLPFFYKNYFDAYVDADVNATLYSQDSDVEFIELEDGETELEDFEIEENEIRSLFDDNSSRIVPGIGAGVATVVEKVYDVQDGSLLKKIAELGKIARKEKLVRVKHTIEPALKYRYVPDINQSDNLIFDSIDQLDRKNLVSWELTQRLLARYELRDDYRLGYGAIAPTVNDFQGLESQGPIDPALTFGADLDSRESFQKIRRGTRAELVTFRLGQSYDLDNQIEDESDIESVSDLNFDLILAPNSHVKLRTTSNYDTNDSEFSSYAIGAQLIDKRGDELRAELRFIEDNVRQLEAGLQILVTDHFKIGYYGRYDSLNSEFLENKVGMRLSSDCNCWLFDVELSDEINPNNTSVSFTVTMVGLGEFGSRLFNFNRDEDSF